MARPGFEPTTSRSRSGCSTTEPAGLVKCAFDGSDAPYRKFKSACSNVFHKSLKGALIGAGVLNRAGMVYYGTLLIIKV